MSLVSKFAVLLIWLPGLGLALAGETQAQVDVVVSFVTTNSTPLISGFSFVTGSDPSLTNSSPPPNSVQIQTQTGGNPVTIPPYSVTRLEWQAFDLPQRSLTLNAPNATPILHWTGLTNVTYTVQRSTNLFSTWSTIGWIPATQTSLAFTNWLIGAQQFYRLAVP